MYPQLNLAYSLNRYRCSKLCNLVLWVRELRVHLMLHQKPKTIHKKHPSIFFIFKLPLSFIKLLRILDYKIVNIFTSFFNTPFMIIRNCFGPGILFCRKKIMQKLCLQLKLLEKS